MKLLRLLIFLVIGIGALARLSFIWTWSDPWTPHHPDEHIIGLEAVALWEGVAPREIGWPASTTRLVVSGVTAVTWLASEGRAAWNLRGSPDQVLERLSQWIGRQYADPTTLYQIGRGVSVAMGILQLLALAWAARQWAGPIGSTVATLGAAIGALPVVYSQYVLADITGLVFATVVVGLAARPTRGRILGMAALTGLAASSKFHFGLWLLTPIACAWTLPNDRRGRWTLLASVIGLAAWVNITLVPWWLTNTPLTFKEFAGVVLVKVFEGSARTAFIDKARLILFDLGALTLLGSLLGFSRIFRAHPGRLKAVVIPTILGLVVLLSSGTVFDRYGLVLLPGLLMLSAIGWDHYLDRPSLPVRALAAGLCAIAIGLTGANLMAYQARWGESDPDVLARRWILEHVPSGKRVGIYDEVNAFLPRSEAQLRTCVAYIDTSDAYREKWKTEGVAAARTDLLPLRFAIMNDERFAAYWCQRELAVGGDPRYDVTLYHDGARFNALLERDIVEQFKAGGRDAVDVLVMNHPIDAGIAPVQIRTRRSQRFIYVRSEQTGQ